MKRPGIEYFIGYLSQFYEIVVFTSQYAYVSDATRLALGCSHSHMGDPDSLPYRC